MWCTEGNYKWDNMRHVLPICLKCNPTNDITYSQFCIKTSLNSIFFLSSFERFSTFFRKTIFINFSKLVKRFFNSRDFARKKIVPAEFLLPRESSFNIAISGSFRNTIKEKASCAEAKDGAMK